MIELIKGILGLCAVYYLIMGEWPEIPPEVINECFDRWEEIHGNQER